MGNKTPEELEKGIDLNYGLMAKNNTAIGENATDIEALKELFKDFLEFRNKWIVKALEVDTIYYTMTKEQKEHMDKQCEFNTQLLKKLKGGDNFES